MAGSIPSSPFPGLRFAGPMDDFEDLSSEITMTEDWLGYLNERVVRRIEEIHPGPISHFQFVQDLKEGEVIIVPTDDANAYGATKVEYGPTNNNATVNLRLAVKRLKVEREPGRVRIFKVRERMAPSGSLYLAFVVRGAESRPVRRQKNEEQVAAGDEFEE